jgi:hypothetical protein
VGVPACLLPYRVTDALTAADPAIQVDSVILQDGEEHKNMDELATVRREE